MQFVLFSRRLYSGECITYLVWINFQGRNLSNFFVGILENRWFHKYIPTSSDLYYRFKASPVDFSVWITLQFRVWNVVKCNFANLNICVSLIIEFLFFRSKLVGILAKNRRTQEKLLHFVHKHKVGLTKNGHNFRKEIIKSSENANIKKIY